MFLVVAAEISYGFVGVVNHRVEVFELCAVIDTDDFITALSRKTAFADFERRVQGAGLRPSAASFVDNDFFFFDLRVCQRNYLRVTLIKRVPQDNQISSLTGHFFLPNPE